VVEERADDAWANVLDTLAPQYGRMWLSRWSR
jgi:hypothetical protein